MAERASARSALSVVDDEVPRRLRAERERRGISLRELRESDGSRIDLWDDASESLRWAYSAGDAMRDVPDWGRTGGIKPGQAVAGLAFQEQRAFMTADYLVDSRFETSPGIETFIRKAGIRAVIAVPLTGEDKRPLGVLSVVSREPGAYSDADVETLTALATHASIAIVNANLMEALAQSQADVERRAEAERTLRQIAARITALREPDEVLQAIVDEARRQAGAVAALEAFAASLEPSDRVAMEVSGGAWEVARILEPHVQRVVVVSPDDTGIAQARTKTDKLDARAPASLLWKGGLEAVWMPDERARVADSSRGHALRGADHRLRQSIFIELDSAGPHLADRVEFSSSALESAGPARDRCVQPRRVACGTQVRCVECVAPGELVAGGGKLVGSAQWRDEGALLQHGSILVDDDQSSLPSFAAANNRKSGDAIPRPATLRALLGRSPDIEEVAGAMFDAVRSREDGEATEMDEQDIRAETMSHIPHFLDEGWTWLR